MSANLLHGKAGQRRTNKCAGWQKMFIHKVSKEPVYDA